MTAWKSMAILAMALPVGTALGHGSMGYPISRTYSAYLEGPESPTSDAAQDAVACGGSQPLYDWHEVTNFFPGTPEYQRTVPYELYIPNGRLASGNNDKYACYDAARNDWPATEMTAGPTVLTWAATVIHNPSVFNVWVTTSDWDSASPLNWDQMEELEVGEVQLIGNEYKFEVDFPERTGRHVVYCIWQRLDPVGEGFYSASDVIFGEGGGGGDDGGGDDGGGDDGGGDDGQDGTIPQGPDSASISLVNQWPGSWQGEITVDNSFGELAMLNWKISWEGGPNIVSLWDGTLTEEQGRTVVRDAAYNAYIPSGGSKTFSFIANGEWAPIFSNVQLNGYAIDIDGVENDDDVEEPEPCSGDVNLDGNVDVLDMLSIIDDWNSVDPGNPADLDNDGVVAVGDVMIALESWGPCP
jgi:chitin-binding protein